MHIMSAEGFRELTVVYKRWERWIQSLAVLAILGLLAALWLLRNVISDLPLVGYPAVFFLSLLGSAAMVVPVPGLLSVCALSLELIPAVVALVAAFGESIGELTGYAVGYGGRRVIERRGFYLRVSRWMENRGTLAIFLVSIIPNPFFDVIGIAAGDCASRCPGS